MESGGSAANGFPVLISKTYVANAFVYKEHEIRRLHRRECGRVTLSTGNIDLEYLKCYFPSAQLRAPICIVGITGGVSDPLGRGEEWVRESQKALRPSTGKGSVPITKYSTKYLNQEKAQNSSNSCRCYVLAFAQRLPASAVESW